MEHGKPSQYRSRPGSRRAGAILLVALLGCTLARPVAVSATTLTVLHVNDTHSHLDATGPRDAKLAGTVGGIARAATVIARERAAAPDALLLHGGDLFQGDLFFNQYFGVPELGLLAALGFDAMTVGNHELDFGPDTLAGALAEAFPGGGVPLLSANLDLTGYPALSAFVRQSLLRNVSGVEVGIFGMTTPDDPMMQPDPVQVLGTGDPVTVLGIAGEVVADLRAAGAEVVICMSHLGYAYDQALAANVPGIDVIVGAHDHLVLETPTMVANPAGGTTIIVQAGCHYRYVGRLRLDVGPEGVRLGDYVLLPVDEAVPPAPQVQAVVDQLKDGIVARWGDVYGTTVASARKPVALRDDRGTFRDSPIGDLVTDALRTETGTDLAITTDGLISEGLAQGPLVAADVFRVVSYGYDVDTGLDLQLATCDITGAELLQALEITLGYLDVSDAFFVEVSGIRFAYDPLAPVGKRVVLPTVRVGDRAIDPSRTYSATVDAAIVALLPMLGVEVSNVRLLPTLEYEALLDHVRTLGVLDGRCDGRIRESLAHLTPPAPGRGVGSQRRDP
jgi:5'-nucleotidase/UDP-sugar diphosphatase